MKSELLKAIGINYDEGLGRCMGNVALYEKLLTRFFSEEGRSERILALYACGEITELSELVHDMKGICGNLSITVLYDESCRLMELFRGGKIAEAEAPLRSFAQKYESMREAFARAM